MIDNYETKMDFMLGHQNYKCPGCGEFMHVVKRYEEDGEVKYWDNNKNEQITFSHVYPKPRQGKRARMVCRKLKDYMDSIYNGMAMHESCNQAHASITIPRFKWKATCTYYQAEWRQEHLTKIVKGKDIHKSMRAFVNNPVPGKLFGK